MLAVNYKLYGTLFDSFAWFKQSESDDAFQEFIDKINRVKTPSSEKADKGSAFNELVDKAIHEKYDIYDREVVIYDYKNRDNNILTFNFDSKLVREFSEYFEGSISQLLVKGNIETKNGIVELYGYTDEIKADTCYDIKTTSNYTFPKFLGNFQHLIYPYCLIQMGFDIRNFEYTVTDFKNTYKEQYLYNQERDSVRLMNACNELTDFLETYRHLITDKKIFGGEND